MEEEDSGVISDPEDDVDADLDEGGDTGVEIVNLDLDLEAIDVDLNHCRLKSVSSIDWQRFVGVESLCLRNNLIAKLEGFEPLEHSLQVSRSIGV